MSSSVRLMAGILFCVCLFLVYSLWVKTSARNTVPKDILYLNERDELLLFPSSVVTPDNIKEDRCTMETCFDFSKCIGAFKVYVYPYDQTKVSSNYANILKAALRSRYYTSDPKKACVFLPSLDPLDRDRLSTDYQRKLEKQLKGLPYWNNGKNHLIFNLYSGTYPDYTEILDINIGKAILVKASMSSEAFRNYFDISLPLFSKLHPLSDAGYLPSSVNIFPFRRRFLASFKGKRYLKGFGSETRNTLHKLHNDKDIIMLTTCKHAKNWWEIQDERCSQDNELYESYDYQEILRNSTFCFAPRGRRLGSFRFLESLSVGCVPVLLANGYQLPFNEVIDWKKALINVDERQLFEVDLVIQMTSDESIALYRQQNQFLWEAYFSSVEKIVLTVIEIVHQRVNRQVSVAHRAWNTFPGALVSLITSVENKMSLPPISVDYGQYQTFTAVLVIKMKLTKILELVRNVSKSSFLDRIVVIWAVGGSMPKRSFWPSKTIIVQVKKMDVQPLTWKPHVKTDAVFFVDNFANITPTEINLAFSVWKTFPNRIAGIHASSHFWNAKNSQWSYTGKIGAHHRNGYSIILLSVVFYHRYYDHLYTAFFPKAIQKKILVYDGCLDISMNFLVAHVTRLPPIKVLKYDPSRTRQGTSPIKYSVRNACFRLVSDIFGYIPLFYSNVVFVNDLD